jgi:catechol 2,3-dioxygenase-like lactoylglutathione lyase family enzyme
VPKQILGIYRVTAIAGEPQQNIDFYAGFLGQIPTSNRKNGGVNW